MIKKHAKYNVSFQIQDSKRPRLEIIDGASSEDESDTPSISRLEDVFSDDYFYDT